MSYSRVSVIIPTQRRPQRLAQALASIGNQTYAPLEVIVVNDGGLPIEDVVAAFQAEFTIPAQVAHLPESRGVSAARNMGARLASGQYLALLDDDDRYRPDHIARLVAALEREPQAAVAYDDALIQIEDGDVVDGMPHVTATCRLGLPYDKTKFDQDDYILTSAIVMRREAFTQVGGFDETMPFCEDWDLLLKLRQVGDLHYVPGVIGVDYSMRIAGDHTGSVFNERRRWSLDELSRRYGLPYLAPKTFFDVARDLGCAVVPVIGEAGA